MVGLSWLVEGMKRSTAQAPGFIQERAVRSMLEWTGIVIVRRREISDVQVGCREISIFRFKLQSNSPVGECRSVDFTVILPIR